MTRTSIYEMTLDEVALYIDTIKEINDAINMEIKIRMKNRR